MTTDERFERDLPDLLAQLAPRVAVDYRDAVVQETAAMRQRPAWAFPARWLPEPLVSSTGPRSRPAIILVTILVLGALVTAMLVAYAGFGRRPLPAPFGPASNGAIYAIADGNLTRLDDLSATPIPIKTAGRVQQVIPSRDGTRLAILGATDQGPRIVVTDADGGNATVLAGTYPTDVVFDWSPDGESLAVTHIFGGVPLLTILPTDGSPGRNLTLGVDPGSDLWYLPDGRILFDGQTRESSPTDALYVVDPAGGPPTALTEPTTLLDDHISFRPSPDGLKAVYHRWREPDQQGRIRVVDVLKRTDVALAMPSPDEASSDELAQFSPDGHSILFVRFLDAGNQLMLVPAEGGDPVAIGRVSPGNLAPDATFSPDGRSVLARYQDDGSVWVLDLTGSGEDQRLDLPAQRLPSWQRRGG